MLLPILIEIATLPPTLFIISNLPPSKQSNSGFRIMYKQYISFEE